MLKYFYTLFLCVLFVACTTDKQYRIGVSQCSEDDWRSQLNTEIQREARFQGDMEIELRSADDNSQRQVEDIEYFIAQRKDLIIVAPNVADDLKPAIEKAYDSGIPVILIDRRTSANKYTAFVGADNEDIGRQMCAFVAMHSGGRPARVVEMRGLRGSTPDTERHKGFVDGLSKQEGRIEIVGEAYANWNEDEAQAATDSLLRLLPDVDYIYAHNDRMACGTIKAVEQLGLRNRTQVIGVDALLTDSGGVDMVNEGRLLATHIYPTGGSEAIRLASKILRGEEYPRHITLPTAMVSADNARVLKLQYQSMKAQDEKYLRLEHLTDKQLERINMQDWLLGGLIAIVLLVILLCFALYRLYHEKRLAGEMMMDQIRMLLEKRAAPTLSPEDENNQDGQVSPEEELDGPSRTFLEKIEEIITHRMDDNNLSVNDIADELHVSRVQLYRKIKAMSDVGVSDLIKKARLERAHHLLATTDMNVSEVAYEVGFSTPSYFAKCYKEYWGEKPSEVKR